MRHPSRSFPLLLGGWCWLLLSTGAASALPDASVGEIRRSLTLLNVVTEEYREGVLDGKVILPIEYEEASAFLDEAEQRLGGASPPLGTELAPRFDDIRSLLVERVPLDRLREEVEGLRSAISEATGITEEVFPPAPASLVRGRALFAENCVSCHGERADGHGPDATDLKPPPANFTDGQFMRGETPFDFFHVITVGRRNAAMAAWGDVFSLQERWDLVSYLWTARSGTDGLAEGQGTFLAHCAGCHGAEGDGAGPFSARLLKPVPPLNRVADLARKTDAELFALVAHGVPGSPMPGYAGSLNDDSLWAAVAFTRYLSMGAGAGPGASDGSDSGSGRRFSGLLRLMSDEYRSLSTADAAMVGQETTEVAILLEQVERQREAVLRVLAERDPDAAATLATEIEALADSIRQRQPAEQVSKMASSAAAVLDRHFADPIPEDRAPQDSFGETRRLLAAALDTYERGEPDAIHLVSDAYFQFEPLEKRLAIAAPQVTGRVEARFLELRGVLSRSGGGVAADELVASINADLDLAAAALAPRVSPVAAAIQSATIILREGFEVVLIIGALIAYVVKSGNTGMRRPILWGAATGVIASLLSAWALVELFQGAGTAAEALEGATMLLASGILFFVSYWLISKAESAKWQSYIAGKAKTALSRGSGWALGGTAFLAVYREGVETALFYRALLGSAPGGATMVAAGFAVGAVLLLIVCVLFVRFGLQVPIRQFFFGTSLLLYYLAFVFAGKGIAELQEAGWIAVTPVAYVPRIDLLGINPTAQGLAVQAVFLACLAYAILVSVRRRSPRSTPAEEVLIETRRLRELAAEIRTELANRTLRDEAPSAPTGARLESLIARMAALEARMALEVSGNGGTKL